MIRRCLPAALGAALSAVAGAAHAHVGHAAPLLHLHGAETLAVAVPAVALLAWWLWRGGRR